MCTHKHVYTCLLSLLIHIHLSMHTYIICIELSYVFYIKEPQLQHMVFYLTFEKCKRKRIVEGQNFPQILHYSA